MQVEEAFLKMSEALGLQATSHAHLDAAAIKAKADASDAKDARIAVLEEALRTADHWLRVAHGKTATREKVPGVEEEWVIDLSPGIEVVEAALERRDGLA